MKFIRFIAFIFLLMIFASVKAETKINRKVLALWDSKQRGATDYTETSLHQNIEVIFNYYGLNLHYVDIANPKDQDLFKQLGVDSYRGVVTWFNGEKVTAPEFLLEIYKKFSGVAPVLILGDWGFLELDREWIEGFQKITKAWGLEVYSDYVSNPLFLEVDKRESKEKIEFERALSNEVLSARKVLNKSAQNEVWLNVNVKGSEEKYDLIAFGKWGGYVQTGYNVFVNPQNFHVQWRVDPFLTVRKVFFDNEKSYFPIPDVTTICGRRSFFSHIDGDGYINVSSLDRKSYSGEIINDKIIKEYKIPVSASVVVAEIDPDILGNERVKNSVIDLFKNPLVEPASHTYSHPLSWEQNPNQREREAYLDDEVAKTHKGPIVAYKIKNYRLDYKKEISGSIDYINKELTTRDQKSNLLFWSGSCKPPLQAMRELGDHLNFNGGDSRLDHFYNSYTHLSSLYRDVEDYVQVYSGAANENLYTNLWVGPYSGFKDVVETFKRTEKPYRIKPINIYYHFYSGEKEASLNALKIVYDYAVAEKTNPIWASEYIKNVLAFKSTQITKIKENEFEVNGSKHLRTLRIDRDDLYPDYEKSINVLGHNFTNNSLYLTLGNLSKSKIILTKDKPTLPHLVSCNGKVESIEFENKKIKIHASSHVSFDLEYFKDGEIKNYTINSKGDFSREVSLE